MNSHKTFFIYPSEPKQIKTTICDSIKTLSIPHYNLEVNSWEQVDIPGHFIASGILERIDKTDYLVADITHLNFNVTFEIGYAIGRSKRVIPLINKSLRPQTQEISILGIFDTIGYKTYENSQDLISYLSDIREITPLNFPNFPINRNAPIFILDTLYKTNASIRIASKVKKSAIKFRSYDPKEQSRLSTIDAYRNVKQSIAIIVNLLSDSSTDFYFNNLRGAFIAGLSYGLEKLILILHEQDGPIPIDYRDFVSVYDTPYDIDKYINELAPKVTDAIQSEELSRDFLVKGFLPNLDIGSPAAENEMSNLGHYYVATDEFHKVLTGSIRLSVGRKGSGKTALFFQARDAIRDNKKNIVLDLKPEGHQLKRFREVLQLLSPAVIEHVATAFWEYVLLLEICHKLLQKDYHTHQWDHNLSESYQELVKLYGNDSLVEETDFSERIYELVNRIKSEYEQKYGATMQDYMSISQVNELIYKHDIPVLRQKIIDYLKRKDSVWILFDNIDKGWPTRGIEATDIIILRALLESTRKLDHFFKKNKITFYSVIFIRNDVYEILVDESPDRGKESKVSLDWTDSEHLKELMRRRLVYNELPESISFKDAWQQLSVSHIEGEDSACYLLDRSLMRPRNFLKLVDYSKSNAVNLQHDKIYKDDFIKACSMYSADLVNEIGLEIRDVFPEAEDILYYFIGAPAVLTLLQIQEYLKETPVTADKHARLIEILLWFGFLGILKKGHDEDGIFIYNVFYDMKKLKRMSSDLNDPSITFIIHKAFWPFLEIQR